MQNKTERKVRQYHRARRQRVRACAALTVLALVVSMGTGLALIKPAATMENTTYCGIEAHIHNEECFEPALICTEENREGHAHTDACWGYPCGLEEREGHTHNEECTSLGCGMTEAHVHTDCVDCTLAEAHTHDESCYEQTSTLICGLEESAEHAHDESCYETQTNVICGKAELPEHIHGESCQTYVCGQAECEAHSHELCGEMVLICGLEEEEPHFTDHVHDPELCYEDKLICEKEEHEHVDACYVAPVTYCGLEEHFHSEFCVDENGLLVCGMENHVHVDECFVEPVDEAVKAVIEMIDQLPEPDELYATAELLCEDEESYMAYAQEIANIAWPAYYAYEELTEEQKAQVTNFDKLMDSSWLWSIMTLEESAVPNLPAVDSPHYTITWDWEHNTLTNSKEWVADANQPVYHYLRVFYVDEDGNNILMTEPSAAEKNLYTDLGVGNFFMTDSEIQNKVNRDLYTYQYAYVMVEGNPVKTNRISYNHSGNAHSSDSPTYPYNWHYVPEEGESFVIWEGMTGAVYADVYLVYTDNQAPSYIQPINENIHINLYDYGSQVKSISGPYDFVDGSGVKAGFYGSVSVDGMAKNTGNASNSTPLSPTLVGGYPQAIVSNGTYSLKNLFDDTLASVSLAEYDKLLRGEGVTHSHNGIISGSVEGYYSNGYHTDYAIKRFTMNGDGGLFYKNADGYYVYDCSENAAYFNGTRFELYDALIAPGHRYPQETVMNTAGELVGVDNYWYNFLPFDQPYAKAGDTIKTHTSGSGTPKNVYFTYYDGVTTETTLAKASGTTDAAHGAAIQALIDGTDMTASNVTNLWFGMSMDFHFLMPKNGQMPDSSNVNQDMVFEFSGDDDVYIYVDDVLVLNIGGTHGRLDGIINFATGEVTYTRRATSTSEASSDVNGIKQTVRLDANGNATYVDVETTLRALFAAAGVDMSKFKEGSNTFADYSTHKLNFYYMERGGNISFCGLKFNMPTLPENALTVQKVLEDDGLIDDTRDYYFQILDKDRNVAFADTPYEVTGTDGATRAALSDEFGIVTVKGGELATFPTITADNINIYVRELIPVEDDWRYDAVFIDGVETERDQETTSITRGEGEDAVTAEYHTYTSTAKNIESTSVVFVFTNDIAEGDLSITKQINRTDGVAPDAAAEFQFRIQMPESVAGTYAAVYSDAADPSEVIFAVPDEAEFAEAIVTIKHGQTLTIQSLPAGTVAIITELNTEGYSVKWSNVETITDPVSGETTENVLDILSNTITTDPIVSSGTEVLICTNTTGAVLPSTGGMGTAIFYIVGAVLMLGAVVFLVARKKMGKEE